MPAALDSAARLALVASAFNRTYCCRLTARAMTEISPNRR